MSVCLSIFLFLSFFPILLFFDSQTDLETFIEEKGGKTGGEKKIDRESEREKDKERGVKECERERVLRENYKTK